MWHGAALGPSLETSQCCAELKDENVCFTSGETEVKSRVMKVLHPATGVVHSSVPQGSSQ